MGGLLSPSWFFCQFWSQLSSFLTLDAPPCCPIMFLVEAGLYLSTHIRASSDLLLSSWDEMDCVLGEDVFEEGLPLSCLSNKHWRNELWASTSIIYNCESINFSNISTTLMFIIISYYDAKKNCPVPRFYELKKWSWTIWVTWDVKDAWELKLDLLGVVSLVRLLTELPGVLGLADWEAGLAVSLDSLSLANFFNLFEPEPAAKNDELQSFLL